MLERFVGETIKDKLVAISLVQEGEETYRLEVMVDHELDYNDVMIADDGQALKQYRAKQFEYFNKVKDNN